MYQEVGRRSDRRSLVISNEYLKGIVTRSASNARVEVLRFVGEPPQASNQPGLIARKKASRVAVSALYLVRDMKGWSHLTPSCSAVSVIDWRQDDRHSF